MNRILRALPARSPTMSDSLQCKPKVLIIGAGLGGTALAQALRKRQIPFEIFERDSSDGSRAQGWALSLHPWTIKEFAASTPDDLPQLDTVGTTYPLGIPSQGAIFDVTTMKELRRWGGGCGDSFIHADRARLRQWLLNGLNVHWNKKFTHFSQQADGVTAFFEDGTSSTADILVGADGIGSRVRTQLLPDPKTGPKYLPIGSLMGELVAPKQEYKRLMKIAPSFFIGCGRVRVFVGLRSVSDDKQTIKYFWFLYWYDEEARNRTYWTDTASQEKLHSHAVNRFDFVDPTFRDLFRATPVSGMLMPPLRMRDMIVPELPRGRVTLLGDAAHSMVPFRGEGGNQAMKDGFSLAHFLATGEDSSLEDVLKAYESEMGPRGTEAVLQSRAAAAQEIGNFTV